MALINNSKTILSLRDSWETPEWLTLLIQKFCKVEFVLDPCCTDKNSHGVFCFTVDDDGLKKNWVDCLDLKLFGEFIPAGAVWVNPPFSQMSLWIDKVIKESKKGLTVFLLHPDTPDTAWYQKIENNCKIQLIPTGRINFVDPETGVEKKGVAFPSCISIFNSLPGTNVQRVRLDISGSHG